MDVTTYDLGNEYVDLDSIDKHDAALLVIRKYAEDNLSGDQTKWMDSAKFLWPALYNNEISQAACLDQEANVAGRYFTDQKYSQILRQTIAYSAIDEGTDAGLVFGDTGIKALFDDATDLGKALEDSGHETVEVLAKSMAEVLAQFAG